MTPSSVDDPTFRAIGDGCYQLTFDAFGVQFTIDRLRREKQELHGELSVACVLPGARKTSSGFISVADMNLSSLSARVARAKHLAIRSDAPDLDWVGFVDELCIETIAAERRGTPAKLLDTFPAEDDDAPAHDVDGLKLLQHESTILFADGGGLKSYLAGYGAGVLSRRGVHVGYADWEQSAGVHRRRLVRLFGDPLPKIYYFKCESPLIYEVDRIARESRRVDLDYLIFDSAGFATAGPPEAAEHALAYFRAVRQIGLGSLHLAHINRSEQADQKPFGSTFWHNSARLTWYAKQADPGVDGDRRVVGLYNRKSNLTKFYPSIGFQFDFSQAGVTTVTRVDLADVDELAAKLPLWQRIAHYLRSGGGFPRTIAEIAEALGANEDSVQRAVSPSRARKGGSMFTTVPGSDNKPRIALVDRRTA